MAAPVIGFASMLMGLHARTGIRWQIGIAILALVFVELTQTGMEAAMDVRPGLWPLHYVPGLAGLAIGAMMLRAADRTRRPAAGAAVPA